MPARHLDGGPWVWLLLVAQALAASAAAAQDAVAVAIAVVDADSPVLGRKLRAELEYAGFSAVDAETPSAPAAIVILSAQRVQISVQQTVQQPVQRVGAETRFEQTLERRPAEGESFALRVVEALRARLVDVGFRIPVQPGTAAASTPEPELEPQPELSPQPERLEPAPARAAPESRVREPSEIGAERGPASPASLAGDASSALRLWLDAGAAGSWSSGGLGATPHVSLGARLELGRSGAASLRAHWPVRDAEVEAPEGRATTAWSAYTAALERALPLPPPWLAGAGLGAGLFALDARGAGRGGYSGQHQRLLCGAGFVELSGGRELSSWLRLRATLTAGLTAPRPVLRFDGREVASLGRAFASFGLALELGWPQADPAAETSRSASPSPRTELSAWALEGSP